MNIVPLHKTLKTLPLESSALFGRMEYSLKSANADFEKSVRIAKTLAPILNDQSSNERHLETIFNNAPVQEKVIAILMLGFPKNRALLPTLQGLLYNDSQALRMASAIAISQMRDGENNEILRDILLTAVAQEECALVKKTLRRTMLTLVKPKSLNVVEISG